MSKGIRYKIVTAYDYSSLELEVNILLDQGWLLQGGAVYSGDWNPWSQAMVLMYDASDAEVKVEGKS